MQPDHEIYPMPLFVQLTVSDLEDSVEWYRALGFEVIYEMPAMAHVRYRKYADVMLASAEPFGAADPGDSSDASPPARERGVGVSVYVTVESESVDDVATRAADSGIDSSGPRETAWNTRELPLSDPDGYDVVFSEAVDTERSFEDVMGGLDPDE